VHISASPAVESGAANEPSSESAASSICFLSAHAYCCEFEEGAIILDVRGDTYLGIDARHLSSLRSRIGNWPNSGRSHRKAEPQDVSATEDLIKDLFVRGILTTSIIWKPPPATHPIKALTVMSPRESRSRIPLAHMVQFLMALLMVAWGLRRARLAALLGWLRRQQSRLHRGHAVEPGNVAARLASFLWLRSWFYTASRRCLFDSLVLSVYLTRGTVPCTFVIGVATKPFLAHAWVQIGESVLNDTAERVHDFKPILNISGE
jgi:Transglutaminase-like superfamily